MQRFLLDLTQDIVQRRSLLVVLPPWVSPEDIWGALQAKLWNTEICYKVVSLAELQQERPPAVVLAEALGLEWPSAAVPRTVENLIVIPGFPELIYLDGFAELSADAKAKWIRFMTQWADLSQSCFDQGIRPAALCMIIPGPELPLKLPENSMYLSVRWLWGIPSALEMHLLCRQGSDAGSSDREICMDQWRGHVLPSLVGNDVTLAEYLWDRVARDSGDLTGILLEFAHERGWTQDSLFRWKADEVAQTFDDEHQYLPAGSPREYTCLCAHGVLSQTPEYGFELSSPALAVLGRNEELQHRVWRGQALLLLPLLDRMRLHVLNSLSKRHGSCFLHVRSSSTKPPGHQALPYEWGELEEIVKDSPECRFERGWLPVIVLARRMRNQLAHYHPVNFNQFLSLRREFRKITV